MLLPIVYKIEQGKIIIPYVLLITSSFLLPYLAKNEARLIKFDKLIDLYLIKITVIIAFFAMYLVNKSDYSELTYICLCLAITRVINLVINCIYEKKIKRD